jgi:hypothetical protein
MASKTTAVTHKVSSQAAQTASSTATQNNAADTISLTIPGLSNVISGNVGTPSSTSTTGTPSNGTATTGINWQDIGIRIGLVVGGSILVIVGIIRIFTGQPVQAPGTLSRRRPTPTPPPQMQSRSYVETRQVGNPPANPTVRTRPNVAAAAAGEA